MKRFTIIFTVLLFLAFGGTLFYVNMSPDFEEPKAFVGANENPDDPVWDMTMEDLLSALAEQGLIDRTTEMVTACAGVSSDARSVSGAEFYWWDVENLSEDSAEMEAYQSMKEEGSIDLWNSGYIMTVTSNGPFGVNLSRYTGDVGELERAFQEFGH